MIQKLSILFTFLCCFLINTTTLVAQDTELSLANEYFQAGEYEKARVEYEKLARREQNLVLIYNNYVATLLYLKQPEEAQKFIKRLIKQDQDNVVYKCDHFFISLEQLGAEKADKEFQTLMSEWKNSPAQIEKAALYFLKNKKPAYAGRLYELGRKQSGERYAYAEGLALVYAQTGEKEKMINELLNWLEEQPLYIQNVKNILQTNLASEEDKDLLETKLYEKIQKDPNDLNSNELLLWLNIQRKNFDKAYNQARAIDRRNKMMGEKMIEVGQIALSNRDYSNAARYFEYVVNEYRDGYNYAVAKKLLINTKEEEVKSTYPVKKEDVQFLITQYRSYVREMMYYPQAQDATRNMALLYAFYLNNIDSAMVLLQEVINKPGADIRLVNKSKIDLADIYLLKGEPWESTLLYSQVEKAMKEDPIGYQAKLSNAKLSYFRGDFELAKQHLDILKLATTREISNDAIDLSLFIQINIDYDSNFVPLEKYASAELYIFQNQYEQALQVLQVIQDSFPTHPLIDDIYWTKARVLRKMGRTDEAISLLEYITQRYATDVLGDDALFMLAMVYEQEKNNREKAMELYQKCMTDYPNSTFVTEARKRYRILRGDKL